MNAFARFVAVSCAATLVGSCVSSERLARHSPLTGDASSERINLWPLLRTDGDGASVAWPLFDVDSQGFALRPLVATDGSDWEVLYPWSHHDGESGVGWALPAYWSKNVVGLFPLFHLGQFSFVGPVYWRRESGRTRWGGVFPLALLGDFNHVGPAWWESDGSNWGVFPLFGVGATRHVGPVWWRSEGADADGWGVFPLVWTNADASHFGLLPFYMQRITPQRRTRVLLAGLAGADQRPERRVRWAAPLYYDDERKGREDEVLLPFYYERKRGDETQVFTLLGNRSVRDDGGSLNLYPLWWSSHSGESATKMLLPFFYYEKDGDERSLLTPLGGRGWSQSGATRYLNVLGPLYHHSESADERRETTAVLWPLFESSRDGEERTARSVPFFSSTSSPSGSEGWYAFGLGHFRSAANESAQRVWPFYSSSVGWRPPWWLYDTTLYGAREMGESRERWLFPFFSSSSAPGRSQRNYLLGLGSYATRGEQRNWRAWPFAASSEFENSDEWLDDFTLVGSRERPESKQRHVLTPLVFWQEQESSPSLDKHATRVLTLAYRTTERSRGLVVPDADRPSSSSRTERRELSLGLGLFTNELERFVVWRDGVLARDEAAVLERFATRYDSVPGYERPEAAAREILTRHGHAPAGPELPQLREALAAFIAESSYEVSRRAVNVPLVFDYERSPSVMEWSGPLGLIHSRRDEKASKFSFLYYGYRRVTQGETTRRDIFPFITWDSGSDSSEVSFLWRFLRYRRDGERVGGHVLFIPWGDS